MTDVEKGAETSAGGAGGKEISHVLEVEAVLENQKTSTEGLSSSEASKRLQEYGPNQLTEKKKRTLLEKIWAQINNVLVLILIIVAVISVVKASTAKSQEDAVTNWIEVALIILVITLNAWIGIMQEGSAEKSADALKAMLSSDAEVIRDGKNKEIPAADIVPGDIVVVKLGDRIPADIRMITASNLACQEAALTGESLPVEKTSEAIKSSDPDSVPLGDRINMSFSATLVSQGRGTGVVVATGDNTQIGNINALVSQVEDKKTEVLKQIDQVSKMIAAFVVVTAVVTFCVAYLHTGLKPLESVSIALVCAVAMIPEGLASIVSLTYAWAVSTMAKLNAIIRVLPAVETLGSVTVICSDKTGTLTKNEMTLTALITSNARYKFDTDAKARNNTNFVRQDNFMAKRAGEMRSVRSSQFQSIRSKEALAKSSQRAGHKITLENMEINDEKEIDNEVRNLSHVWEAEEDFLPENFAKDSADTLPVKNGGSPNFNFFNRVFAGGILCSNSVLGKDGSREGEIGNPTELAIMRAAYFAGVEPDAMRNGAPQIAELPFSSEYKFMATVHNPVEAYDGSGVDDQLIVHVKGAPDRMIPLCSSQLKGGMLGDDFIEPIDTNYWLEQASILSSYGLRVLALCRGTVPKGAVKAGEQLKPGFVNEREGGKWLTMVAFCAIMDPPRPECVHAIAEAHLAGVRVAMITGDHKDTALAIGDMLGIVDQNFSEALTGPELDAMDESQLRDAVMKHNVFARASPENKIQIVEALQAEKQICSMTGDGVNDAPALKRANMGVAMGKEGTDVAREASEMILADDNFATIVAAVREGRVVWDNLRKILLVNTCINNAQGMSVLFGMVFGLRDPLLSPIQVLYCNLICAVTLGFVLAVEPAEDGIMHIPPRKPGKRLIGRFLWLRIALGTVVLVTATVGAAFWNIADGYKLPQIRSQALNTLSFSAISICMSARFAYNSSLHPRVFTGNQYLYYALIPFILLQLIITYVPFVNSVLFSMGPQDAKQWGIVVLFMVITYFIMEAEKAIRRGAKAKGMSFQGYW